MGAVKPFDLNADSSHLVEQIEANILPTLINSNVPVALLTSRKFAAISLMSSKATSSRTATFISFDETLLFFWSQVNRQNNQNLEQNNDNSQ